MQPDLETLRIMPSELEELTGLEISETFMGRVYRPSLFRQRKRLAAFLVTELLALGLSLIFCLPIGIVIASGFGIISGEASSAISVFECNGECGDRPVCPMEFLDVAAEQAAETAGSFVG